MAFTFKCSFELTVEFLDTHILPETYFKRFPEHLNTNPDFWDLIIRKLTEKLQKKSIKNIINFSIWQDPRAILT